MFRVDPAKVPTAGVRARCSVCGGVIAVSAGSSIDEEFAPARPNAEPRAARVSLASATAASPSSYEPPTVPFHAMASAAAPASRTTPPAAASPVEAAAPADHSAVASAPPPAPAPRLNTAPRGVPVTPPIASPRIRPTPAAPAESTHATPGRPAPAAPARPTMFPPRPAPTPGIPSAGMPSPAAPRSPVPPARVTLPPLPPVPAAPRPPLGAAPTPPLSVPPSVARPAAPMPPAAPPAPPAARPAPSAPAAGAPTRAPINPFLANDPNAKARRLSRALVSDLVTYFPQRRDEGLREGTLRELFREEIKKSYEEYTEQVGREFAEATTHFQEALNDILASGQKLF